MSPAPSESHSGEPGEARSAPRPTTTEFVRHWLMWWVVCAGLWMVLDDTTAVPELVDGAVAAMIGASAATLTMARSPVRFASPWRSLGLWWRPLRQFASDLPALAAVLADAVRGGDRDPGGLRTIPFRIEPGHRERATQVALASVVGSFAPNSIVVAIDESGGTLVVHELTRSSTRIGADPLELG